MQRSGIRDIFATVVNHRRTNISGDTFVFVVTLRVGFPGLHRAALHFIQATSVQLFRRSPDAAQRSAFQRRSRSIRDIFAIVVNHRRSNLSCDTFIFAVAGRACGPGLHYATLHSIQATFLFLKLKNSNQLSTDNRNSNSSKLMNAFEKSSEIFMIS